MKKRCYSITLIVLCAVIKNAFLHNQLLLSSAASQRVKIHHFLLLFILTVSLIISGCQPIIVQSPLAHPDSGQEETLPFETIEQQQPGIHAQSWTDPNPGLLIIAKPEDIKNVSGYITDEAKSTLTHLDFTKYFALLAFDGWKSELLYDFHVDRIVRQGKQVVVLAQPSGKTGTVVLSTESSLYHLVKIKKEGNWNQSIMFKLYFHNNQAAVITVSHYIP